MNIQDLRSLGWTMEGIAKALRVDASTVFRWHAKGDGLDYASELALRWIAENEKPEDWKGKHAKRPSLTYLILDGDAVKIGRSQEPGARLRDLQVGCVRSLKLLTTFDTPEHIVHAACKPFHLRGEWFRWCPELRQAVNQFLPKALQLP